MSAISIQLPDLRSLVRFETEQLRDPRLTAVHFDDAPGLPLEARTVETDCLLEAFW